MKKVAVIMLQPMGGTTFNYTSGQEVLVPEEVAAAWEAADIAKRKKGAPSSDAAVHPDPVESHEAKAEREAAEAQAKADAEAKAKAGGQS